MINGIIKLFYNDKVKSSMKNMPNKRYLLDNRIRRLKKISNTMDEVIKYILQVAIITSILIISFNNSLLLSCTIIAIMSINIIYKKHCNNDLPNNYRNKINSFKNIFKDVKKNLFAISSVFLIGIASDFNYVIVACLAILLVFTTKEIYSNINR
ncbi:MAG: hypothetical protein ACRCXT_09160 [Paraclostridium sp.]